jgi:hypothetical protein
MPKTLFYARTICDIFFVSDRIMEVGRLLELCHGLRVVVQAPADGGLRQGERDSEH